MAKALRNNLWQSDDEFELLLKQSLSAIQPPADFSDRVMAAVRRESAAPQSEIIPFAEVKQQKKRFGHIFWPGLSTIAASLVLMWAAFGLPGDNNANAPGAMPQTHNLQVAAEIEPLNKLPHTEQQTEPITVEPVVVAEPSNLPETEQQESTPVNEVLPEEPQPDVAQLPSEDETGTGELILPRAAFGTDAQGTLSVRLLAEVENSQIYSPAINRRGNTASFYTADDDNVYSWRVDLSTANSPEVALVTSRSSLDDIGSMLVQTTQSCDATTLLASPDGTIMAQNSPDGLWISLTEGEVYSLSEEGGGSLLAWSPDSSKLLFTNSQGQLFMGYPLEKRIYQITDLPVTDVCWSTDNQTIIFLAVDNGQDALYIAELI